MTDAQYEAEVERIDALFEHFIHRLAMKHAWNITIRYLRSEENNPGDSGNEDGTGTLMVTNTDWERCRALIRVYTPLTREYSDDHMVDVILEELFHVIVNETRMWRYHDERVEKNGHYVAHEERVVAQLVRAAKILHKTALDPEGVPPWPVDKPQNPG